MNLWLRICWHDPDQVTKQFLFNLLATAEARFVCVRVCCVLSERIAIGKTPENDRYDRARTLILMAN